MAPDRATLAARLPVGRRRIWLILLAATVVGLHILLATWVADSALDLEGGKAASGLTRLKAVFIAELRPTAPPMEPPRAAPPPPRRAAAGPAPVAASAPESRRPAETADPVEPEETVAPPPPLPLPTLEPLIAAAVPAAPEPAGPELQPAPSTETAASAAVATATPAPAPASAAAAPGAVDWPRSTRLTYTLTGNYRGPVDGRATVEWLREGNRYQVHLEVSIGPSFAPLVSRRMSSDGEIGADGLAPRRYEEETKVPFRDARRLALQFDGPLVRLANGSEVPRPPGLQDTASQFVQLTWLFTTQPGRLRSGQSVDLMLALPRRVEPWTYDVLDSEPLYTPAGVIDAVHVRPRRPARAGDLTAEMWTAPSLQYLPVRIVIRQDTDTWVDLLLDRLPQQAAGAQPR